MAEEILYTMSTNMKNEENRLQSFTSWSSDSPMKPRDLAQAGFYYLQTGDAVQCFCCSGRLNNWEPEDVAWNEHARHFPNCFFVLGYDVGNIPLEEEDKNQDTDDPDSTETFKERLSSFNKAKLTKEQRDLLEKLRELQQQKQCKVCLDRDIRVVFLPCAHLATCQQCSKSLIKCPICCSYVRRKLKIFIP